MATTLAAMRALVRARLRLSSQDPLFTDAIVNRAINLAYSNVAAAQPNGWWWQHDEQTRQNGAAATATFPVRLEPFDNARLIRKVGTVFVSLDGTYWLRVERRERQDQIRLAGGRRVADGLPLSWSPIMAPQTAGGARSGLAILFDPPLPANAWVRFLGVVGPADLTADGDFLSALPSLLTDLVVESTVAKLAAQRRAVGTAASRRAVSVEQGLAKRAATDWLTAARTYLTAAAAGPAYATQNSRHA